ncbi:sensor histidine kinase [Deinococcus knuensis]|uniref:histidine kinase n=1 Tax=Deinococcus knuensis TaxID=1837380 RepID=A0ABQ2SVZ0_9DEIO|nr:HAMP domain-containing sensor histidine kinase [Deinococcus knuensis]GGS39828.1 two-component sensor histidine kinase [Deinococcus knuensis]
MTLRWRLTLSYAALLALTLLTAGFLSYQGIRQTLHANLDTALKAAAITAAHVEARPDIEPTPDAAEVLDMINNQNPIRITIFNADGRVRDRGPSRVGFTPKEGAQTSQHERVFMHPIPGGWVQASQSDAELIASLRRTRWQHALLLPGVLIVSMLIGYSLANRALRPIDQVSAVAARIARSGQPGERVPVVPGTDELAQLTRTINDMLAQLDIQLAHERLFAHASAHELRTPISVIRAAASLALEHDRAPDEYRHALTQIRAVSEDMSDLTDRLLCLARSAHPRHPAPVNLADVALMVTELHATEAGARQVKLTVTAGDAATTGDLNALILAAGNLVQNAVRHAPADSTVQIWSHASDGYAWFTVQDAGPGIPAADITRLLRPFERGTSSPAGAGLGLALVRTVVDAHGGTLDFQTPTAGGLRVTISLPTAVRT